MYGPMRSIDSGHTISQQLQRQCEGNGYIAILPRIFASSALGLA
jgi:hypothetical protein